MKSYTKDNIRDTLEAKHGRNKSLIIKGKKRFGKDKN